jgi:hypothetical protein
VGVVSPQHFCGCLSVNVWGAWACPGRSGIGSLAAQEGQREVEPFDLAAPAFLDGSTASREQILLQLIKAGKHLRIDRQHGAADACIRCPMLHVNPKMLARLDDLETDLLARRNRAEAEGWAGEIEGIDLTLSFLRTKREDTTRRTRHGSMDLGMPVFHADPPSGHT